MKKVVALCLIAMSAYAGERALGIISEIGTTTSNLSQNPDAAPFFWDGGFAQPFLIPEVARVTVVCSADMYICTDKTSCTATTGLPLSANVLLPTSVGGAAGAIDQKGLTDAGLGAGGGNTIRSAVISILNQAGDGGYHNCKVFERRGNE